MHVLKRLLKVLPLVFLMLLFGCDISPEVRAQKAFYSEIDLWAHFSTEAEVKVFQAQVNYFNQQHDLVRINAVVIPSETYQKTIKDAALENALPDIIAVNSNYVSLYADQKFIIPMDKFLTDSTRNDLLVPVLNQGAFNGRLYMVSPETSGLVLYANKEKLLASGGSSFIEQPEYINLDDFEGLFDRLAKLDDDGVVMDMNVLDYNNWAAQMLLSQLSESSLMPIDDITGSSSIKKALLKISSWGEKGYLSTNVANALLNGDIALSWSLLSDYPELKKSMGENLVMIPFPGFFSDVGSKYSHSVTRGWGWSVTKQCDDVQAAMRFIEYIFQNKKSIEINGGSKLMPATLKTLKKVNYFTSDREINFINNQNVDSSSNSYKIPPDAYFSVQTEYINAIKGKASSSRLH